MHQCVLDAYATCRYNFVCTVMYFIHLGVKIVELYWVIHKCDAFGPDMMRQVSKDVKQLLYVEKKHSARAE